MAQIRIKRSTGSTAPSSSDLANAELAFTEGNDILYYGEGTSGSNAASVIKIGGSGAFCDLTTAQTVAGNKTFSNNVTVTGNLTVNGTTTTVATTNTTVADPLLELNSGASSNANDCGIIIERGSTGDNAFMGWDESEDKFGLYTTDSTASLTGNVNNPTTASLIANLVGDVTGNVSGSAGSFTAGSASNLNSGTIPAARIADDSITEVKLDIHNSPSTNKILKYTSNGMEWASEGSGSDTTYTHTWVDSSDNAILRLTAGGSGSGNDDLTIVAGSNITLTPSGDNLTIAATDTNTTYSVGDGGLTQNNFTDALKSKLDAIEASATADQTDEEIQDIVGAMFTGNTETGIAATYQDADGTIDLVIGTLNQNTTGNAATATTLETARNIGGVSFDGSANIDLPGVNSAGNQNTTGNAATATALATARNIGGVSFDGTANIDLPGVNSAGNQNTSGNAATATTATTATNITATANNSADETTYLAFVDGTTGSQGIETDTGLTYNPSSGVLTTTSVTGNLTGNVTGNTSGSSGSCTGNATTATTATNVTCTANNSTDETVYLTFVDAATGGQGIETDTGLSYNPSSGLLTVGSIDGGTF